MFYYRSTVHYMNVHMWNKLVLRVYGKPYLIPDYENGKIRERWEYELPPQYVSDYSGDFIPEIVITPNDFFGVSWKLWNNTPVDHVFNPEWTSEETKKFWEDLFFPDETMIACHLWKKGVLPSGKLIVVGFGIKEESENEQRSQNDHF